MRRWLVGFIATAAACGGSGTAKHAADAPAALTATFTDLGAPAVVQALAFDGSGAPIAFAAATSAGPFTVARYAGGGSTPAAGISATTAQVGFVTGGSGTIAAVVADGSDVEMWQLADAAAFTWAAVAVPQPPTPGSWRIAGQDTAGTYVAIVDGAGLSLDDWTTGSAAWTAVPGFDEAGDEQGVVVAPDGAVYVEYSPPATENFNYQQVVGGATTSIAPCAAGEPTVFAANGTVDAASDMFFEDCASATLYVVRGGGACYAPVVALPTGVCGLAQTTADGTVFIFPTEHGDHTMYRLAAGATTWQTITGDIDGIEGYVARDATTLFRFGNSAIGLAEADL
jgi:hypothetical protein